MNWKKGFQRITLVVSVLIILIGAGITASTVSDIYSNYRYYNTAAFQRPSLEQIFSEDTGFNPDAYLAKKGWVDTASKPLRKYEPVILPTILWGALFTILAAAFPWVIFGLGLYLVGGFRAKPENF